MKASNNTNISVRGILYKTPLSNVYINVQIEVYYFQTDLYLYVNVNGVLYKIPLIGEKKDYL